MEKIDAARTLKPEQEKKLQKTIYNKCPDQMKLPFALWTKKAVQQLNKANLVNQNAYSHSGRIFKKVGLHPKDL